MVTMFTIQVDGGGDAVIVQVQSLTKVILYALQIWFLQVMGHGIMDRLI